MNYIRYIWLLIGQPHSENKLKELGFYIIKYSLNTKDSSKGGIEKPERHKTENKNKKI